MQSNLIIGSSSGGISDEVPQLRAHYKDQWQNFTGGGVCEIEEEEESSWPDNKTHLATIREDAAADGRRSTTALFDFGRERAEESVVYVVVGRQGSDHDQTSMSALTWALKNAAVSPLSVVMLVHVFPEIKYIPTPLGNLPIRQVNPDQKEIYMAQEGIKRRGFLHKFLKLCNDAQVKADTILIESDMEAKAILDLMPILNMRRLVLGANKSTARRMRSRKGNGVVDQIVQGAPEFCEVKIICDGKEMSELMMESSSSHSSSPRSMTDRAPSFGLGKEEKTRLDSAGCGCFKL